MLSVDTPFRAGAVHEAAAEGAEGGAKAYCY